MNRRDFLKLAILGGATLPLGWHGLAQQSGGASERKFILSAPLTHSDWRIKPGIAWGDEGVRHMLDACK